VSKLDDIDKILGSMVSEDCSNPYADRANWSGFDYMIGYGCPLAMAIMFIVIVLQVFI